MHTYLHTYIQKYMRRVYTISVIIYRGMIFFFFDIHVIVNEFSPIIHYYHYHLRIPLPPLLSRAPQTFFAQISANLFPWEEIKRRRG